MNRTLQLVAVLAFIIGWAGIANASLMRYNVTVVSSPHFTGYLGYMSFSNPGPGDIFSSIADWHFELNGYVFDASIPGSTAGGTFRVNSNGVVTSDVSLVCAFRCIPASYPLFQLGTSSLFFIRELGLLSFSGPNSDFFDSAVISYSAPIDVSAQIPAPASLGLFGLGLISLRWSRLKKA